ncbi:MAG: signal peptidase I [Thiotrichaceae bacterium]|nr:signal peptidase I [Thiotrichaceae bacterium]
MISTLYFGLVILYYFLIGNKRLPPDQKQMPLPLDFAKSFFPILLFILILRSFVAEPFRIPSGSMIPTLEVGDFVLVKKYSYGLRLPIIQTKIIDTGKPKRGDVVVFRYPPKPEVNYIKRVIGLPGDHIKWTADKKLIINEQAVAYKSEGSYKIKGGAVDIFKEALPNDDPHDLILFDNPPTVGEWRVPEGHYFMMGDNRDKSSDSRSWGFVPEANLVGKASLIWMHWNWLDGGDGFQVNRIGTAVN